ncbi:hypothetical protein [Ilumatobacter sp.]|uniref:hypothetical protein n=1 Tax=Ilumatobacter sp. TaxID=1967498 RepID=UPI003B52AD88
MDPDTRPDDALAPGSDARHGTSRRRSNAERDAPAPIDGPDGHRDGWRRFARRALGPLACLTAAVVVAACATAADDAGDGAPPEPTAALATEGSAAPPTDPDVATDPPAAAASGSGDASGDAPSYAHDIEPILSSTCANCHIGSGPGTQHVRFDTAGIAAKSSAGIATVVGSGFMPPWPASDDSVEFDHDWSLTDAQVRTLVAWDEAGSPLDVDEDREIVASDAGVRLDDPTEVIASDGSYDGEVGQPDEYRCFVYELPTDDRGGFLTAMDFLPDQEVVVHHAVGFLVRDADRDAIAELDDADPGGGWTCFGFTPSPTAELVYGWAPGQNATRFGDGAGLRLEPGDLFVMQTHYHFDVEAPADRSELAIEVVLDDEPGADRLTALDVQTLVGPAEIPCAPDESGPLCERDAALAAAVGRYGVTGAISNAINAVCGFDASPDLLSADGIARSSCDQAVRTSGEIVALFGHEHELGASFRMTLHPDTPDEVVLLDIPEWDFDWQLVYEPAEPIEVRAGDTVRLECSWDRSRRDPDLEPAWVLWSEGTDDEMCFAMVTVRPDGA